MNNTDSKEKMINLMSWTGLVAATIITFFVSHVSQWTTPIQVILWLGWLIVFGYLFTLTDIGNNFFTFAKEAKNELYKVVWPTRPETVQTTMVVMAMVIVVSIFLWGIDTLVMWAIGKITHLG